MYISKSGAAAGVGVDLALFPLDTIKTRLQSKQGLWKSGSFRGIYNGLPSTLLGSAPTAALFFTVYDTTKTRLSSVKKNSSRKMMNATVAQLIAANLGEVMACLIRVPVDVVKQRSQASHVSSTFNVFKQILARDVHTSFFLFILFFGLYLFSLRFERLFFVCFLFLFLQSK